MPEIVMQKCEILSFTNLFRNAKLAEVAKIHVQPLL